MIMHHIAFPNRLWVRHRCDGARAGGLRVHFNDFGVRVEGLSGVTRGCPFCWRDVHMLTCEWWERYRARCPVARPEDVAEAVAGVVRRLERPGHPANGVRSHHGVGVAVDGLWSQVMVSEGRLQVNMYQSLYRRPAQLHHRRVDAVTHALTCGASNVWNGLDGSDGVSLITTRSAPEGLAVAVANYVAMGFRCFDPTPEDKAGYAAFDAWYGSPL